MAITVNDFPLEIICHVISYLSDNEFANIARVCKKWATIIRDDNFWKTLSYQIFGITHKSDGYTWKLYYRVKKNEYTQFVRGLKNYQNSIKEECFWAAKRGYLSLLNKRLNQMLQNGYDIGKYIRIFMLSD
jgi:hypothetical protein